MTTKQRRRKQAAAEALARSLATQDAEKARQEQQERIATVFCNYPSDVTNTFDMSRPYGPNTFGELLWPVSIEYNEETGKTRVGFSFLPPPGV